mgnify:CR=1 FL=1
MYMLLRIPTNLVLSSSALTRLRDVLARVGVVEITDESLREMVRSYLNLVAVLAESAVATGLINTQLYEPIESNRVHAKVRRGRGATGALA